MNTENKNLIIALILMVFIFASWHYFYEIPNSLNKDKIKNNIEKTTKPSTQPIVKIQTTIPQEQILVESPRLPIKSSSLNGSINLRGAKIDELTLRKYWSTTDKNSNNVKFFSPIGSKTPYYSSFGWYSDDKSITLPDENTIWKTNDIILTPKKPITLFWDNKNGLMFKQIISIDDDYLFNIVLSVTNNSNQTITLSTFNEIIRINTPKTSGFAILHEGPLGYFNGKLEEINYTNLQKKPFNVNSTKGWLGFTDKYWLAIFIPDQTKPFITNFQNFKSENIDNYKAISTQEPVNIMPGKTESIKNHLFAGAKILNLLDNYENKLGVKHLDLAVDFGMFYIITKPIFFVISFFNDILGNFGLAILLLTVIIKAFFFPLANKSYKSMAKMKLLQPEFNSIRERYSADKVKMNQEVMTLYKKHKVNPISGCLPMIIQIPVFFALYKVLFISIEMRHAPFFWWGDLSAPDPLNIFTLFGLIPWALPNFLNIGVLPLFMGFTMLLQQKLNPPPADPVQAKVFLVMPIVFTFLFAQFPVGLVLYWTWNNILSIIQQWIIMKKSIK